MPFSIAAGQNNLITATNNSRLSRRVLWAIILLYLLPGLFARAPWSPDDSIGFSQAYQFALTPLSDWPLSFIGDRLFTQEGLLSAWLAGGLGKFGLTLGIPLDWLDDFMRLGNVFWMLLAGWSIWHTTYRLARRAELQPADPFGNAPTRIDYARAVADASVLCFLGTLGLLLRSHLQVAEVAELAGLSLILLAAVRSLDRPLGAGWMLGLGIAIAFFARGWVHLTPFVLALVLSSVTHPSLRFCLHKRTLRAALVAGILVLIWFFWLMNHPLGEQWWSEWLDWNATRFTGLNPQESYSLDTVQVTFKTLAWFLWPILPMSLWSVWRYRKAIKDPAIRIPIVAALAALLTMLVTNPREEANYFPMLAPLSVLAAIGLSTMRRGLVGLIDWFALLCFSFGALLVWIGWSAATFGWPTKIASNFEKLSPGYLPDAPGVEFAAALLATFAWLRLIQWRTSRSTTKSKALWRPMVLTSGGVTLIWLLLMTLWIPRIDYAKNYAPLAQALENELNTHPEARAASDCVVDHNLGFGLRGLLQYHSTLTFKREPLGQSNCRFVLIQDSLKTDLAQSQLFEAAHGDQWARRWMGNRNSDRHERLILFQRIQAAQ